MKPGYPLDVRNVARNFAGKLSARDPLSAAMDSAQHLLYKSNPIQNQQPAFSFRSLSAMTIAPVGGLSTDKRPQRPGSTALATQSRQSPQFQ